MVPSRIVPFTTRIMAGPVELMHPCSRFLAESVMICMMHAITCIFSAADPLRHLLLAWSSSSSKLGDSPWCRRVKPKEAKLSSPALSPGEHLSQSPHKWILVQGGHKQVCDSRSLIAATLKRLCWKEVKPSSPALSPGWH